MDARSEEKLSCAQKRRKIYVNNWAKCCINSDIDNFIRLHKRKYKFENVGIDEISKSYIWRSHWDALTEVITFISNIPVYKPSPIGEVFLKGIDYGDTTI